MTTQDGQPERWIVRVDKGKPETYGTRAAIAKFNEAMVAGKHVTMRAAP